MTCKQLIYYVNLFFLLGCQSRNEGPARDFIGSTYVKNSLFERIDVGNCDYFAITYPSNMDYAGYCGMAAARKPSDIRKDSIDFIQRAKHIVSVGDSCNLYVGKKLKECSQKFPLPSVTDNFTPLKGFPIDDSSVFVILNSVAGNFLSKDLKVKRIEMPRGIEHGYSEGVILSRNQWITYWLIIW